jgi:hypothetical protein
MGKCCVLRKGISKKKKVSSKAEGIARRRKAMNIGIKLTFLWFDCSSRKEIAALQSENYSLERQLFSYQKSIAYAHHARSSQATDEPHEGEHSGSAEPPHRPYLADRSVSTETEYA